MKQLILPVFLSLIFLGCQNDPGTPQFEEFTLDQVSELNCDPEEENCAYISIHIPWINNPGRRNKLINAHIEQHVIDLIDYQDENNYHNLEALSQNFIDNYETSSIEFPEYNIPWEAHVEGKVLTNSPNLLSIEFDLAIFTGGAHGFSSKSFLNIDPTTGEELQHDDLFTREFKDYAEAAFRKKHEIPQTEPINSTGYFFENDRFYLPQNIGFLKNKIILRYNAYEVASYAEGSIELEIPREEAQKFIKFL